MMLIDHLSFSFQGSLKVGTRTTSMKYIQAEDCGGSVHVSVLTESVSTVNYRLSNKWKYLDNV